MKVSRSAQSCALGAAIAGAVVSGGHKNFAEAQASMCGVKKVTYKPIAENHIIYKRVYALYKQIHDAFGSGTLVNVMKELLNIKDLCTKS
jgi:L-ribulokinase